jgi:glycosyltransferase involved in cell wall biosynthesis
MKKICEGVEVAVYRQRHPLAHLPALMRNAIVGIPTELIFHQSKELAYKINLLTSSIDFDVVQIEHSYMAPYLNALPSDASCKRILVFRNVVFDQYDRIFRVDWRPIKKLRALIFSAMMRRWEPTYAQCFDRCIALSNADRSLLLEANPDLKIDIVPNGTDTQFHQPLALPKNLSSLLFVGSMSYTANVDAVIYFCQDILPLIREKVNHVDVWIVGKDPLPEVKRLNGNGIRVTGRVEDVVPYYQQSTISVVPLRAGSGTRLKILEAMALGRPVVSTSLGCEGLDVEDGKHLLIADTPEQFAESTARLLNDQDLYQQVRSNARELVENYYDWDVIARKLVDIYRE